MERIGVMGVLSLLFATCCFAQNEGKKDSIIVEIKEDSLRKKAALNKNIDYEMRIYLFGYLNHDTIKLTRNNKIFYSNVVSTMNEKGNETMTYTDRNLRLKIRKGEKDDFRLFFNGAPIDLLFRYGYADLTIDAAFKEDKLINRYMCSFMLEYTNDFFIRVF